MENKCKISACQYQPSTFVNFPPAHAASIYCFRIKTCFSLLYCRSTNALEVKAITNKRNGAKLKRTGL